MMPFYSDFDKEVIPVNKFINCLFTTGKVVDERMVLCIFRNDYEVYQP